MAQPSNTYDSYDAKGIREDLENVIYNISPEETPFYSSLKKTKASNTYHEWQTDTLRDSAANAHIEGDETTATAVSASTRLGNRTQIFKNAVIVSDTDEGMEKAGRSAEMAYQTLKIAKEQKLDIEKSLFSNTKQEAGNATTARTLAGLPTWLLTNVQSGASPTTPSTGDGLTVRVGGTARTFDQDLFDAAMQDIWSSGGKADSVYLSAYQMNIALGFTGNNNQRSSVQAGDKKVVKSLDVYVTPWGTVEFTPTRENEGTDVFIIQNDMWSAAVLRPTKNTALAKTGDSTKRQVLTELTLVCKNEKASGSVMDLTIS
jgi:hypothetical protein